MDKITQPSTLPPIAILKGAGPQQFHVYFGVRLIGTFDRREAQVVADAINWAEDRDAVADLAARGWRRDRVE
jgi:hypothetical protein